MWGTEWVALGPWNGLAPPFAGMGTLTYSQQVRGEGSETHWWTRELKDTAINRDRELDISLGVGLLEC